MFLLMLESIGCKKPKLEKTRVRIKKKIPNSATMLLVTRFKIEVF